MPVLTATGAGVRHRRRWLFHDLDVTAEPGDLIAVVGVPGSGRTTVLLALAGRFRLTAGKVSLSGTAALGCVPDVEQPEPVFSVTEHVRERLALLGRPTRDADAILADGGYGLDPTLKGWQLTPYQKQLLGLVLARLANPALIALDGVDDGLDASEQAELWRILGGLAADGVTVVVTAREIDPECVTTVVRLADPQASKQPPPPEAKPADEALGEPVAGGTGARQTEPADEALGEPVAGGTGARQTEPVGEAKPSSDEAPATNDAGPNRAEAENTNDAGPKTAEAENNNVAGAGDGEKR
jgi:ABC-2 type transport system ATP-binding protein